MPMRHLQDATGALRHRLSKALACLEKIITEYMPVSKEIASLLGCYFVVVGLTNWLILDKTCRMGAR
jgi:hypothetical protein